MRELLDGTVRSATLRRGRLRPALQRAPTKAAGTRAHRR